MHRRSFLAGSVAGLAAPNIARAAQSVLRMVPQANLTSIDPIWTTANVTRNHGFMVYDTLYGLDASLQPQPQMAAGHQIEDDGRTVTITLRDGLIFHDNENVRAIDAVASLRRWMKRNPYGQALEPVIDELSAIDDTRLRFRLKKPFPLLFNALASIANAAFVMPERIAATDPFKQINDPTGSGPFRFNKQEFNSGSLVVYERHVGYRPRPDGTVSLTAGPKRVFFDRVEWRIITDAATSAAALQQGEIDWWEQPTPELRALFAKDKNIVVDLLDPNGMCGAMRLNASQPPFNDKALRQALLPAIDQADFMMAIVGADPHDWKRVGGVFTPGTPMANDTDATNLTGPRDFGLARKLVKQAGYTDQPTRLIGPTDILAPAAMTQVAADLFKRLGFNQDLALSDWGTVIQRRSSKEPVDKGGWSALCTSFSSFDFADPAVHPLLRGNGAGGWFGWPVTPELESLRSQWFDAPDEAARKAICRDIQHVALDQVAYIPLGSYSSFTATRADLTDRVNGFALFWNLRRT
ncbi:MAG TPA: ABC transporter substrate-binding protein [Rhodopila sp.]|nr:ABC transporter substrate-binding protein [Rhodopila sp.]